MPGAVLIAGTIKTNKLFLLLQKPWSSRRGKEEGRTVLGQGDSRCAGGRAKAPYWCESGSTTSQKR